MMNVNRIWESLKKTILGTKDKESTPEDEVIYLDVVLNRARRRYLASMLNKNSTKYKNIKAKYLPHRVPYNQAMGMCEVAGINIHDLLAI
jgi:hypothetical protein